MRDPYQVLGISPDATDDEVKAAYRKLAKKYHPDNFAGSDLSGKAEEKMKEINAAYQEIQDIRSGKKSSGAGYGGAYGYGRTYGYGNTGNYYGSEADPMYAQISQLIYSGRISEAEVLMDRIQQSERSAKWHFYMGHIYYRKGYLTAARNEFKTACDMDPSEAKYRNAYDSMSRGSQSSPYGNAYGNSNLGDICSSLMCLNCVCQCMRCCR